jgi:predicted ATPase
MLTRIEIDGFKSFTNFSMEFSPLTIVAGLNASGKSNLFDALHLLSLLAEKPLAEAFNEVQRGSNLELFTQYADGRYAEEMRFAVEVEVKEEIKFENYRYELWVRRKMSSIGNYELVVVHEDVGIIVSPTLKEMFIEHLGSETPETFRWVGSARMAGGVAILDLVISLLAVSKKHKLVNPGYNNVYGALQEEIASWKLLHLDPKKIPAPTVSQAFGLPGTLNPAADNLAGVLYRLSKTDPYLLTRIAQRLASLVPGIKEIVVKHDDYYNQYRVFVLTTNEQRFPLHLLSEGTLRLLALCTLAYDDQQHGVLGLEEPENGVHPGLLKRVAKLLRDLSTNEPPEEGQEPWPLRQVIVNTHSPGLIKACLEAAAGQEGSGKSDLTVWFSQLVGRPVDEGGKRVMRRVTDMLPVVLPKIQPSEAAMAEMSESARRVSLAQLLHYLDTTADDPLLHDLGLSVEPSAPRE